LRIKSSPKSSNTISHFYQYGDILLKLFIEIAESGDYRRLVLSGNPTDDQCLEAWEKIVEENGRHCGNNGYSNYLEDVRYYATMLWEYLFMRSAMTKLIYVKDYSLIVQIRELGYDFKMETYMDSIYSISRKVDAITTRIKMHQNKMALYATVDQRGNSFAETIVNLNMNLGWEVSDDITLAKYNEYCKTLKRNNKHGNRTQGNNQ